MVVYLGSLLDSRLVLHRFLPWLFTLIRHLTLMLFSSSSILADCLLPTSPRPFLSHHGSLPWFFDLVLHLGSLSWFLDADLGSLLGSRLVLYLGSPSWFFILVL